MVYRCCIGRLLGCLLVSLSTLAGSQLHTSQPLLPEPPRHYIAHLADDVAHAEKHVGELRQRSFVKAALEGLLLAGSTTISLKLARLIFPRVRSRLSACSSVGMGAGTLYFVAHLGIIPHRYRQAQSYIEGVKHTLSSYTPELLCCSSESCTHLIHIKELLKHALTLRYLMHYPFTDLCIELSHLKDTVHLLEGAIEKSE